MNGFQGLSHDQNNVQSARTDIGMKIENRADKKRQYKLNSPTLTQELLTDRYEYRPNGTLVWKKPHFSKPDIRPGDEAGYLSSNGYYKITINSKEYFLSRVIFLYHHGYMPENLVDHIDRNTLNNRIENLREVSLLCNNRNCKVRKDSRSKITGVFWHKQSRKWEANIRIMGRRLSLFRSTDIVEAVSYRLAAEQCLNWHKCKSDSEAHKFIQRYLMEVQCD